MMQIADFAEKMRLEEAVGSEIARWAAMACDENACLDGTTLLNHRSFRLNPSVDVHEAMARPVILIRP